MPVNVAVFKPRRHTRLFDILFRLGTPARLRRSPGEAIQPNRRRRPRRVPSQPPGGTIHVLMLRETGLPEKGMRIRSRINELHLLRLVDKVLIAGLLDSGKLIPPLWAYLRITIVVDQTNSARG